GFVRVALALPWKPRRPLHGHQFLWGNRQTSNSFPRGREDCVGYGWCDRRDGSLSEASGTQAGWNDVGLDFRSFVDANDFEVGIVFLHGGAVLEIYAAVECG